jgi:DUF1365 family protein
MDFSTLKNLIVGAKTDEVRAAARLEILEGVLADFFRLYMDKDDHEALKANLEILSKKLLTMQAKAIDDKGAAAQAMTDLQAGLQQAAAKAGEEAQQAVDNGLPAPEIEGPPEDAAEPAGG